MRRFIRIFAFAIAGILGFAACRKDDTLRYSNVTMGNIVDGVFISDQGNRFNIVEQTCEDFPDTLKRALIRCDVLSKTEENTYDIRLTDFAGVFTKAPVDSTSVTDPDVFVEDPLMIYDMWIAGGYINMYLLIPIQQDSRTAHLINLVRDDEDAAPGIYEFTLKHNAFGEVESASSGNELVLGGAYVSFPAAGLFKEEEADIIIYWNSREKDEEDPEAESSRKSLTYKWKKGGFEQDMSI